MEAQGKKQKKQKKEPGQSRERGRLLQWLRRILLDNELEIWRKGQPITAVPMLILLIFVIFLYWIAVPMLILGCSWASGIRSPARIWRTRPSTA